MFENLTVRKAIDMAITTEQLGAEFYARMERKFQKDKELKDVFNRLMNDEKLHEALFKQILEKVPEEKPEEQLYERYQFLRATAISEFFRKDAFVDSDAIKKPADALSRALAFEKSTLQYYEALKDVIGESEPLNEIIKTEKEHVVSLMRVIMADAKFRGMADKW